MDTERKALLFNGFGLLASIVILLSGQLIPHAAVDLMVQIFGILLIVWAVVTIKVSKKNHTRKLPEGYFFQNSGPYEIIRHPIYAGYLLVMISIVETDLNFLRLIALFVLCVAILMKVIREEHTMSYEVEEYNEYKLKTKTLIPYLL